MPDSRCRISHPPWAPLSRGPLACIRACDRARSAAETAALQNSRLLWRRPLACNADRRSKNTMIIRENGTACRCQAPPQMLRSRAPIRFRRCLAPARGYGKTPLTSTHPSPNRAPRGRVSRRCLASRFANAGQPIRLAGANRRAWHPHGKRDEKPGRKEGPPPLILLSLHRQRRHARHTRPPHSGWAGESAICNL